jgi:uncharacterized protein YndB with AHSA1/START domain
VSISGVGEAASTTLATSRVMAHPREAVFRAITTPDLLQQWWGPAGFTNTFHECDVRPGGTWRLTMHGPDGTDYPNDWQFMEVSPERIVLLHAGPMHRFTLTLTLEDAGSATKVGWNQEFESAAECEAVRAVVQRANEENLDRLSAALANMSKEKNL